MTAERREAGAQIFNILVILIFGLAALFLLNSYSFLLAHTFAELFSVSVALVIFFIAWNAREYHENSYFIFIGVAYLYVGTIDLLHTLAYKGMGVFPEYGADLATQLWIVGRAMESAALFLALFFLRYTISAWRTFFIWGIVAAAAVASVFAGLFPVCYIEGVGLTSFKRVSELVIVAVLAAALVLQVKRRNYFSPKVIRYLYASLVLTMCAELAFIMYVGVYDLSNLLGHYFKIVSFYLIYRGVIVTGFKDPFSFLMQELKHRNEELEQRRNEIEHAQRITSTMLDNIPEEVVLLETGSCRVIDANKTFLDIQGIPREEALNGYCFDIDRQVLEPCREKQSECTFGEAGSIPADRHPKVRTRCDRDESQRFVEVSVWPVVHAGDPEGLTDRVVYIARDITAHRRAEQMRDDVERVVRHDLKSPLNGIIGGSKMMLQDDNLTGPQINMLEAIYESGLSVLSIVDKSLNLSRMEEGIYELEREEFDLRDVLLRTRDRILLGSPNPDVGLRIVVNGEFLGDEAGGAEGAESAESPGAGAKAPPIMISAERRGIETILSNLILNAIEAAPPQTEVTLTVESAPKHVKFDIHNYGVIPMEVRDRFFERYVTSGKEHGTGLGTYSVYLITKAHGGQVSFTSDEAEGTHLLVEIPLPSRNSGSADGPMG